MVKTRLHPLPQSESGTSIDPNRPEELRIGLAWPLVRTVHPELTSTAVVDFDEKPGGAEGYEVRM